MQCLILLHSKKRKQTILKDFLHSGNVPKFSGIFPNSNHARAVLHRLCGKATASLSRNGLAFTHIETNPIKGSGQG